jgi:hypothetical protein
VNERLRRAKFVPIIARDGETFGELSAEQILGAMNLIQSTPRIVRIQAIARNELRTGDKLAFDLVIK